MGDVLFSVLAARTGGVRRLANAMSTFPQMDGMARPELGQCRAVGPSEARFRWVNGKRRATNDGIRWPSLNILMDGSCVDVILDRVILVR